MGTRPFKSEPNITPEMYRERLSEMAQTIVRESDLADTLYKALKAMCEHRGIPLASNDEVLTAIELYESLRRI